jgi:hypothetical protein
VDLDEILYVGDNIEDDLHSLLLNSIASTIPKWRIFKLLRSVKLLNWLVDLDVIFYCGNSTKGDLDHSKLSVCRATSNFWPALYIIFKFGTQVMPFRGTMQ